jgi:hypothetical protein
MVGKRKFVHRLCFKVLQPTQALHQESCGTFVALSHCSSGTYFHSLTEDKG